ncbi:MAG: hypothetical protein M0T70_07850 [Geobacteraceae bacterium]|nr:hypothetical protein [Geobacteraceae bacterium]
MKLSCTSLISTCFLLALPGVALSAEVSVDATAIVRFEQRANTGFPKQDLAPATQFLGLDVNKLGDGNLSLHVSGWGREDILDKSYYNNDQAVGSLTYGYLQYRFNRAADARLGRFFVHEGAVNEQVDGLSLRSDLPLGFGVSVFGGANVHTQHLANENTDGKGDAITGGRINYRYKGMLELGASGVYESKAPTLTDPAHVALLNGGKLGDHRLIGGDVWFSPFRMVEVMGHTTYNPETRGVAEHTYLLNVKPVQHLVLTGEFNEHRERNFFFGSAMFASLLNDLNEKSRSIGGSASYEISQALEVAADYKHFTRDAGNADRSGGDIRLSFLDNSVRSGLGYHYVRISKDFVNVMGTPMDSYHEMRVYAMHDTKNYFAAVDLLDYLFQEKVNNEQNAWEAMASLGYHLTPQLAVSGDFSYGRNPEYIRDIKGLVRLTYNMTFDSKGGKK